MTSARRCAWLKLTVLCFLGVLTCGFLTEYAQAEEVFEAPLEVASSEASIAEETFGEATTGVVEEPCEAAFDTAEPVDAVDVEGAEEASDGLAPAFTGEADDAASSGDNPAGEASEGGGPAEGRPSSAFTADHDQAADPDSGDGTPIDEAAPGNAGEAAADGADETAAAEGAGKDSADASEAGITTVSGSDGVADEITADADAADETEQPDAATDADAQTNAQAEEAAHLVGWQVVNGKKYYYSAESIALTGSQTIDGYAYYFSADGALYTGYRFDGTSMRFYDSLSGFMLTGEHYVYNGWRDFASTGAMATGLVSEDVGTLYYDTFDGARAYGQQYVEDSWHYFDDDTGYMLTREQEQERVLDAAYSCVGQSEADAWSYLTEMVEDGGRYCIEGPCMSTVRHFFKAVGMDRFLCDGYLSGWPHDYLDYATYYGQVSSTPTVGAVVFFSYPNAFAVRDGLSASHSEIVIEVHDTYLLTIGALEGGIQIHYFPYDYVVGYVLPAYLC